MLSSIQMVFAVQEPPASAIKAEVHAPRDWRGWKRLQASAKTAADYQALSSWCDKQAAEYAVKIKRCQEDLDAHRALPVHARVQKYPTRSHSLRVLIAHYKEQEEYWKKLSGEYAAKAKGLEE